MDILNSFQKLVSTDREISISISIGLFMATCLMQRNNRLLMVMKRTFKMAKWKNSQTQV